MTQNYIERYWRDATPADAIKEPPMVARFRIDKKYKWNVCTLQGIDRSVGLPWRGQNCSGRECQVYDAPDPGEGWRLIDTANEKWQEGDEFQHYDGRWDRSLNGRSSGFSEGRFYRRRITPTVTYVPFAWEDREQLRGRWVTWKHENGLMIEFQIDHINQHRDGGLWFMWRDAKWLLENAKFIDTGKPVGKEVVQ